MINSKHLPKINKSVKWLVIIILLVAAALFLLWPKIMVKETMVYATVVPINIPEGLTITRNCPGIEVCIRGPEKILHSISHKHLPYKLDLSGNSAGHQYVKINRKGFSFPSGIKVVDIKPDHVIVGLEKEIHKTVPISVVVEGSPAAGYVVSGAVATPLSIKVKGPEKILESIQKIFTKPVEITGVKKSFQKEITLALEEGVEIDSPTKLVTADIFIEEKVKTRKFENVPIEGRHTHYQYIITPSVITITVKGPVSIIEKLEVGKNMEVYVDLKDLKPGVYVRCVVITLPVKTTLIDVHPKIFGVTIEKS